MRWVAAVLAACLFPPAAASADTLRVMKTGLGSGTISGTGISCGSDCNETYAASASAMLTAEPVPGSQSTFVRWGGDCSGTALTCTVPMNVARSVRAEFGLSTLIPEITNFTPAGIATYLMNNPAVDSPARFVKALPVEFKRNFILMTRSESLQTGIADSPRILLPSADAKRVFTVALTTYASYPGASPNAIEYMQWDGGERNFRFHEIVLATIGEMGDVIPGSSPPRRRFPERLRGVAIDDAKCFACHSTRNVLNRGATPGTDGIPAGSVNAKAKPNWDAYDSWGGMMPFNRDRIYQGSVEAAAFRKFFNLWTWQTNDAVRSVVEQLELQPPGVPAADVITRLDTGGANDGHIRFAFDPAAPVTTEPFPAGTDPAITTAYEFDDVLRTGGSSVQRGGSFVMLHHPTPPFSDGEGRGVDLFDFLGGLDGRINAERVADEIARHRVATGSVRTDVRPVALAIAMRCITANGGAVVGGTQTITSAPPLSAASTAALAFFNSRHAITSFNQLYDDTRRRAWSATRRRADIEKINLDRSVDPYVYDPDLSTAPPPPPIVNGLIQQYGAGTSGIVGGTGGADTSLNRVRQEVFRRPIDLGHRDTTTMNGNYVDREHDGFMGVPDNTEPVSLFRYFLEPLGVSVDKWSMGVRGRSRTYTFADIFGTYRNTIAEIVRQSLIDDPYPGLDPAMLGPSATECDVLMPAVESMLASLPPADGVPTYTDIQRIFNKSCIECHGGLGYPPYQTYGTSLDFSEDENPLAGARRMTRSHATMLSATSMPIGTDVTNSYLFQRITDGGLLAHPYNPDEPYNLANPDDPADPDVLDERCPSGVMPCGGPPLSRVDTETIRRWIVGARPSFTEGDPHIKTVDGVNYDFQSAGEFVLLRDEGMELQARQTAVTTAGPLGPNAHTGLSSCVSVNTAVALRVSPHRISYQPAIRPAGSEQPGGGGLLLRVDGKVTELGAREILLPSGGRIRRTSAPGGIQVDVPGGTVVVITPAWWAHHQIWYMNIDVRHARATEGVMGAIAPGNWLPALPDASLLGPRPRSLQQRYQDLYETFADAWRVDAATSLFDYEPGLSTASFTVDSWPMESPSSCSAPPQPGGPTGAAPQAPLPLAEAERACSGITAPDRKANCIQDVSATGEPGFAETYLLTERLERNALPTVPVLGLPADNSEGLAETVEFTWSEASDRDGGPLTYRHCVWSAGQLYDFNRCAAVSRPRVSGRSLWYAVLVFLIGVLLLVVLFFAGWWRRRLLLLLVGIAIVLAVLLAFRCGRTTVLSTTVPRLNAGKVYFWKVIAEDGQGGTVESQTRRFIVK